MAGSIPGDSDLEDLNGPRGFAFLTSSQHHSVETVSHGRPYALLCASTSVAARTERSCCFVLLFNYLTLFCNFLQRNVAHRISSPETQETSVPGLGQRLFEQSVHLEYLKSTFPLIPEWSPCTSPSFCLKTRTCPPGAHARYWRGPLRVFLRWHLYCLGVLIQVLSKPGLNGAWRPGLPPSLCWD